MTESIYVNLPWPESALSPNSRDRWAKIKAAKSARYLAKCAVLQEWIMNLNTGYFQADARLKIHFIFHPPDRKYRDLDNMVSMCKAYSDGIFEALNNNDKQIDTIEARKKDVVKGGLVTIEISESED